MFALHLNPILPIITKAIQKLKTTRGQAKNTHLTSETLKSSVKSGDTVPLISIIVFIVQIIYTWMFCQGVIFQVRYIYTVFTNVNYQVQTHSTLCTTA